MMKKLKFCFFTFLCRSRFEFGKPTDVQAGRRRVTTDSRFIEIHDWKKEVPLRYECWLMNDVDGKHADDIMVSAFQRDR
jgi:hypothetical protein